MIRISYFFGVLVFAAAVAQASTDDGMPYGVQGALPDEGSESMLTCTEEGAAANLTGDELDAYVQECMEELYAERELPQGEDR